VKPSQAQCKLLVALVVAMATSQTTRQNTVSLLPTFVGKHHSKYNEFDIGLLLCAYQVGFLLTAPAIGNLLPKIGRKNALVYGMITMSLSTVLYALAAYFKSDGVFYGVSYSARFV